MSTKPPGSDRHTPATPRPAPQPTHNPTHSEDPRNLADSRNSPDSAREAFLLDAARSGDRAAFGQFVTLTQDRVYNLLVRIVGDREEAKELAQDTYVKALTGLAAFRGTSAAYTWLYRIAVNLAITRLRKVRRQRTFSLFPVTDSMAGIGESPQTVAQRHEESKQVLAALGRLDSEYRAVLVMRDVEGLEYRDISEVLELPIGTVKSRLFRARLALREEINRYAPSAAPKQVLKSATPPGNTPTPVAPPQVTSSPSAPGTQAAPPRPAAPTPPTPSAAGARVIAGPGTGTVIGGAATVGTSIIGGSAVSGIATTNPRGGPRP